MKHKRSSSVIFTYFQVITGHYKLSGSFEDADSVIGLSFGMRCDKSGKSCKPDPSNRSLARYIEHLDTQRNLPKYIQHEITEHLSHPKAEHVRLNVVSSKRRKQMYLDTFEVLRQAKIELKKDKKTKPIIVAHAFHVPRVVAIARHMGLDPVVLPGLPRVWDAKSSQIWTKNYFFWIFREFPALVLYKLKNYL